MTYLLKWQGMGASSWAVSSKPAHFMEVKVSALMSSMPTSGFISVKVIMVKKNVAELQILLLLLSFTCVLKLPLNEKLKADLHCVLYLVRHG